MKLKLGDIHPIYGECVGLMYNGERYYWFIGEDNQISLIPEVTLEEMEKEVENG